MKPLKSWFLFFLLLSLFCVGFSRILLEDKDGDGDDDDLDTASTTSTTEEPTSTTDSDEETTTEEATTTTELPSTTTDSSLHEDDEPEFTDEPGDTYGKDDEDEKDDKSGEKKNREKLLVILLDGFRHDFVEKDARKLKAFKKIIERGVHADQVEPVFPSNSYPNYYSIATGLYPNEHGIVDNVMYSEKYDETFHYNDEDGLHPHWWKKAESIWIRAKRHGLKTSVYWWPGCEVEIKQTTVHCLIYKGLEQFKNFDKEMADTLEEILKQFKSDQLDFAMLYHEDVDDVGHKFGPQSKQLKKSVRRVDNLLQGLLDDIDQMGLNETVNVYIISDHGLTTTDKYINLDKIVDFNSIQKMVGFGSFSQLLPEDGKVDFILEELRKADVKGLNVYHRDNLPAYFHLSKAKILLPIILTADEGYCIYGPHIPSKVSPEYENPPSGTIYNHGYDPAFVEDMNGIMFAFGPSLAVNKSIEKMSNVDHYNIWCELLDIRPRKNKGDAKIFNKIKREDDDDDDDDDESDDAGDEPKVQKAAVKSDSTIHAPSLLFLIITCILSLPQVEF